MQYLLVVIMLLALCSSPILDYDSQSKVDIVEPSDVFFDEAHGFYYMVSDEGIVKVKDKELKTIRTVMKRSSDFEAVCIVDSFMYLSDETSKRILMYSLRDYDLVNSFDIHNFGPLNSGIEGLTYNASTNTFYASMEKDPVAIIEYSKNFQQIRKVVLKNFSDISSLTIHNNFLYVLSDEDATISKLDPLSFKVLAQKKFNIINAEGIAFVDDHSFVIVSDASQKLYKFNTDF